MIQMTRRICARLYPFQTKERITKGPISGMTALFGRSFEVSGRRKCHRRAARVSQVKSLSHNTHGPAEALPPTAMGFGKMDKIELRSRYENYLRFCIQLFDRPTCLRPGKRGRDLGAKAQNPSALY